MALLERITGTFRRLVSPPVFVVEIRAGVARARAGEIPTGLLAGLSDVAREAEGGAREGCEVRTRSQTAVRLEGG